MATSSDKYKPYYGTRAGPFVAVLRTVEDFIEGIIRRLANVFTLTEEEQSQAGIYLGGEGRED